MKKLIIAAMIFFTIPCILQAQLSGIYTIGNGGDFTMISEAVDSLNSQGRGGPITFNILDGTYTEQFTISSHTGMSADNPVVFQPQSGAFVKIAFAATSGGDNYVVRLQDVSYITFQDITFSTTGTDFGTIIRFAGASNGFNSFLNNVFEGISTPSSQDQYAILYSVNVHTINTLISGNTFLDGSDGVYMSGGGTPGGTVITNNTFSGSAGEAVYLEGQSAPAISENTITHPGIFYAIELRNCSDSLKIVKNRIDILDQSRAGIYLALCEGGSASEEERGLIANNFITVRHYSTSRNGIFITSSKRQDVYHNSVHVINPNSTSQALHLGNGIEDIRVVNNNFSNTGHSFQTNLPGGYAILIDVPSAVTEMDYNNIFSAGNYTAKWGSTDLIDLAGLQAASGKNANSVSVFPHYLSNEDLHTVSPYLDGGGTPLNRVTEDMDGEPRDGSMPDIGADEFNPDPATTIPLSGLYTIGSGGNYSTFTEAAEDLLLKGISSSIIFDVFPGIYNENLTLFEVPRVNEEDSLVFRSITGNPEDVMLTYEVSGENDNYVVNIRSAKNITFKNLKIVCNTSSTSYGRVFVLQGYNDNIRLINNILIGASVNSSSPNHAIIHSEPSLSNNTVISGNTFTGGSYGIYMFGGSNLQPSGNIITNNSLSISSGYMAIRLRYQSAPVISKNSTTPGAEGIYLENCDGPIRVIDNRINVNGTDNGISLISCTGGNITGDRGLIANNFVTHRGGNNLTRGAVELVNSEKLDIVHNNVNSLSPLSPSLHIRENNADLNILNNIFVNTGDGYAYDIRTTSAINVSDYNDIYTTGVKFAYWDGDRANLNELSLASGKDQNSISADPQFVSLNNLHVKAAAIDSGGTPVAFVTDDIDNELRDQSFPDIGADEFIFGFNYAPVITSDPDTLAYVDSLYQYQVIAEDQDGDTLIFSLTTAPAFLSVDETSGLIEGIPSANGIGEHTVEVLVDDGRGNQASQSYSLHVESPSGIEDLASRKPDDYVIFQNYPNPFNPSTTIKFSLPKSERVSIEIFGLLGQKIGTLVNKKMPAGLHEVKFDAKALSSGVYLYRIEAGQFKEVKKMILLE